MEPAKDGLVYQELQWDRKTGEVYWTAKSKASPGCVYTVFLDLQKEEFCYAKGGDVFFSPEVAKVKAYCQELEDKAVKELVESALKYKDIIPPLHSVWGLLNAPDIWVYVSGYKYGPGGHIIALTLSNWKRHTTEVPLKTFCETIATEGATNLTDTTQILSMRDTVGHFHQLRKKIEELKIEVSGLIAKNQELERYKKMYDDLTKHVEKLLKGFQEHYGLIAPILET